MASCGIKNVILAGATGSVGAPILKALLDEPSLKTSILTRASSPAKFPAGVLVKEVSDAFTVAELTEAFKGQDAVVVAITTTAVTQDNLAYRLIDAAVAAGVKRFIPSEFGANNLDPRARKLVPVYDLKGRMLEYLLSKAKDSKGALAYTSISCGSWLDWGLNPAKSGNFLGIDVKARKGTIYDSGRAPFSITTSTNTGLAVVRALLTTETENKQVFLSDFVSNSRAIISSLERQMDEKFEITEKESKQEFETLQKNFEGGDFMATFGLLALSFVADVDIGYDFEKEQQVWNEKLGLPKVTLDEVVKDAIELSRST